jgi:hypothetical protein
MNSYIHNTYDNVNIYNTYDNVNITYNIVHGRRSYAPNQPQEQQPLGDHSMQGRRSNTPNQPQEQQPIDDCPICFTRCSLQLNYQCNHFFCQTCIMKWNQQCRISRQQCLCPLCRSL